MKAKLIALLAIGLFFATVLGVAGLATSCQSPPPAATTAPAPSSSPMSSPSSVLRGNIMAMLQSPTNGVQVLPDIPGGAPAANNQDAAYYAWQEFVALNWPNVPVTGNGGPGARELADTSLQFGQNPNESPASYPALVWESTRHRAEIYTPQAFPKPAPSSTPFPSPTPTPFPNPAPTPNGFQANAGAAWGYNSTPGYVYPGLTISAGPPASAAIKPNKVPFVNLDEGSQIGTCTMYSGAPQAGGNLDQPPGNFVFFMAKANSTEYSYIASRGWYNSLLLKYPPSPGTPTSQVASFSNTSGYILTQGTLPDPGTPDGSGNPGSYVSFPSGTLEFKAAFRVATDLERAAYEHGDPIPGGYHAAPVRYYQENGDNTYTYVDTIGVLLSLHIIHKTPSAPYFIFATFEHEDDIIGPDGKSVENADGSLQPNAFTATAPTPVPSPFVYPSSGTAPAGQYLIDATAPNVLESPSQFPAPTASPSPAVTTQTFSPAPNQNAGAKSTKQSSYQNTRDGNGSTLSAANSPSEADSYFTVNRRRFTIPPQIVQVNQDVHGLISQYGFKDAKKDNTWLHYKLVNVQWVPAGNDAQKTAGKLYGDTSGNAAPSIPVESYYLSNSLVETNMILSAFSGQFNNFAGDLLSITDFYPAQTSYTDNNTGKTAMKNVGDHFYNVYGSYGATKGPYNMGGCMGCHANATVGGSDASFILGHGRPFEIEGVKPSLEHMLYSHRNYFQR